MICQTCQAETSQIWMFVRRIQKLPKILWLNTLENDCTISLRNHGEKMLGISSPHRISSVQVGQLLKLSIAPANLPEHLRCYCKSFSEALRARIDLIFLLLQRYAFSLMRLIVLVFQYYRWNTVYYRWSWRSDKKHKNLNLFKRWLGPSKLLRCIYGCEKWIPDKIPHRYGCPKKISTFFLSKKIFVENEIETKKFFEKYFCSF